MFVPSAASGLDPGLKVSFLHFHEDPKGLFADLRDAAGKDFDRFDVTAETGKAALVAAARTRLLD